MQKPYIREDTTFKIVVEGFGCALDLEEQLEIIRDLSFMKFKGKLITKLALKDRKYLGPTSMDTEMSLIMANQGLVREKSWVYDPFVGTGSVLVAAAALWRQHHGQRHRHSMRPSGQIRQERGESQPFVGTWSASSML
eukprot:jgi/Pico_ML_1/54988/g115.t1